MKTFLLSIGLFGLCSVQAQSICGLWYSDEYACTPHYFETFAISQVDNYVTCTKIKGDDCVTSGQISWQGNYNASVFPVFLHVGNNSSPNCCYQVSQVEYKDEYHILVANSINMYKYSCKDIDSLKLKFNDYGLNCDCHAYSGEIKLTPDPFSNIVNIMNNSGDRIENVKFFNALGQLIFFKAGNQLIIDLGNVESGIYLYNIATEMGKNYSGKIMKM